MEIRGFLAVFLLLFLFWFCYTSDMTGESYIKWIVRAWLDERPIYVTRAKLWWPRPLRALIRWEVTKKERN